MRIALAWLDLSDPTDGAIAHSLAKELKTLGHDVCYVGPRRRRGEPFRETVNGASFYRVGPGESLAVRQLLRIHFQERIDVWHCHAFARDHRPLIRASELARWPLVVTLHLVLKDYLPFLGGTPGLRRLIKPAQAVSLVSKAARAEFIRLCPGWTDRSSVIYNAAPPANTAAQAAAKPFVLSIARLAPYKGQDLLLMAFAKVLEKKPSLRLILCGRDQQNGALGRFIKTLGLEKRVTLTGGLPPRQVQRLLADCQFFALPSRRENFPLALLEAMAAGKAVVASRTGGVPEMIRDEKDGLLFEPGAVEALARRMLALADDPALRRRLGRNAKIRSREFSWKNAARAYCRLYAQRPRRARLPR